MPPHAFHLTIPVLETERLRLREFREADFEAYATMMASPEVTRFLGEGKPLPRADAWRQMAAFAGHWILRGYGIWAVEERATGRFVGRIGCHDPEGFPAFEIAYTLDRNAWGRGYGREGAAAALRYAREVLHHPAITSIIRADNRASRRVAESLGGVLSETVEFYGAPAVLYRYASGEKS